MRQGRELGAAQLGFSGGEPLLRQDLEDLAREARGLGYYSNLITSGMGLNYERVSALKSAGLDHIQLSFQDSEKELNDQIAGSHKAFDKKLEMAQVVKEFDYPMVINFVLQYWISACNLVPTTSNWPMCNIMVGVYITETI